MTADWMLNGPELFARLAAIDALRPPCPTCDGKGHLDTYSRGLIQCPDRCPDCIDGRVSIEQLAATYNAVHGTAIFANTAHSALLKGWNEAITHLRTVKPT